MSSRFKTLLLSASVVVLLGMEAQVWASTFSEVQEALHLRLHQVQPLWI